MSKGGAGKKMIESHAAFTMGLWSHGSPLRAALASDLQVPIPAPLIIRRYPIASFLVALSLIFITSPLTERLAWGRLVEAVQVAVMLLLAVMAMAERRAAIMAGLV